MPPARKKRPKPSQDFAVFESLLILIWDATFPMQPNERSTRKIARITGDAIWNPSVIAFEVMAVACSAAANQRACSWHHGNRQNGETGGKRADKRKVATEGKKHDEGRLEFQIPRIDILPGNCGAI
jgi:hypothetical protein